MLHLTFEEIERIMFSQKVEHIVEKGIFYARRMVFKLVKWLKVKC